MMKKIALVFVLTAMMLTACSSDAVDSKPNPEPQSESVCDTTDYGDPDEVTSEAAEEPASESAAEEKTEDDREAENAPSKEEASMDNESLPGPEVAELVNLRGDEVTVYKLADGTYMDRIEKRYTYNGTDTWTDADGVEWNEKVSLDEDSHPGPEVAELVNLRGDEVTVYKLANGTYMDRIEKRYTYNGTDTWTDADGVEWNEKVK